MTRLVHGQQNENSIALGARRCIDLRGDDVHLGSSPAACWRRRKRKMDLTVIDVAGIELSSTKKRGRCRNPVRLSRKSLPRKRSLLRGVCLAWRYQYIAPLTYCSTVIGLRKRPSARRQGQILMNAVTGRVD
jgi:hypothetical protein